MMHMMHENRKYLAVIQAGGKGTRMSSLTGDAIPKPMLPICGKPMIQLQLDMLASIGIDNCVIITGHLGTKIIDYFGDGSRFGFKIKYINESCPLGSAGALFFLNNGNDLRTYTDIIYLFSDVMFSMDMRRLISFHESKGADITLVAHPNNHPYDSDVLEIDDKNKVISINKKNSKRRYYHNLVNAGLYVLKKTVINIIDKLQPMDMEDDIVQSVIDSGTVFAYRTPEYIKDVGVPDRYRLVNQQWERGIQEIKNLKNRQKCVFLDRDGTVNEYKGLIFDEKDFSLIDGVTEAIKRLNDNGFLVIVITNQPVVARGLCDIADVKIIHRKMETLLGDGGAYLDDIVFCPHHPDKGYPEENREYKIECNCRKPSTGMIDEMVKKYNINIMESYFVGDTTVDVQTGINAGCKTILLKTGEAGKDNKFHVEPNYYADDLLSAVGIILKKDI